MLWIVGETEPHFRPFWSTSPRIERRRRGPDAGNGLMLPRAFKTPFVGRRLRVSELFFWGHRFRPIVMLSPGGDIQFHPQHEIKKRRGFPGSRLLKFPIRQEKSYNSPIQTRISSDASGIKYGTSKIRSCHHDSTSYLLTGDIQHHVSLRYTCTAHSDTH